MTGNTNRKFVFVAAIGLAALAISVGMVSAAGDTEVSVEPTNETVAENDVQTFEIVVENATDDVQGFNFTVSLSDSSAANIVSASPGANVSSNQSFTANISSDNSSVTLDALLASQSQVFNTTTPTIATVDVEGSSVGQTELNTDLVTANSPYVGIAAQGGAKYNVTASNAATIDVVRPKPNFEVSNLSAPSAAVVGDTINVSAEVTNTGTANGTQDVAFRFNGSELTNTSVTLNVSETALVEFSVDTSGVGSGTYTHGVFTANGSQTAQITLGQPNPNFEVSNLSAPGSAVAGETINVSAEVTNTGNTDATQDVAFRFNGSEVTNTSVTLNVSETALIDFSVDTSGIAPGTYTHGIFTADDNQTAQITIEQPQPNFQVSNLAAPAVVTQGDNVTANATITNTGTASGNETVEFRFNGSVVATTNVSLDPGQSQDVSVTLDTSGQATGDYTHGYFTSDSNQTAQISIVSSPTATFQLSNLSVPANATVGDTVNVSAVLANVGNADGSTTVELTVNGSVVATRSLSVSAGASQTVTVSYNTSGLSPGSYTAELTAGASSSVSSQLTLNRASIQLPGTAGPANSVDSDPLLEDVDGDGSANVFDAIELYNQRNTPAVQNNPQFFDFDGDGNINVFDAIELYNKIQSL